MTSRENASSAPGVEAPNTRDLYSKDASERLYDDRYERGGYMDDWPEAKKRRIAQILEEALREGLLPPQGTALDFGCGTGALTEVLARAMPGWDVWGSDLSAVAVEEAKKRREGCRFFAPEEADAGDQPTKFDFLFTHHVLEHVYDLEEVAEQINDRLSPDARMLHILPCGNPGSFEHRVCELVEGGIDPQLGNRFFFEEPGHVRRLKTTEVEELFAPFGRRLRRDVYAHQHHGAVEWITSSPRDFQERLLDPSKAIDAQARAELERLRGEFERIAAWRRTAKRFAGWRRRGLKHRLAAVVGSPLGWQAKRVDQKVREQAEHEWQTSRREKSGSEMFLFFDSDSGADRT